MSQNFDQTLNTTANSIALVTEVLRKAAGDDLVAIPEGSLEELVGAKLQSRFSHLLTNKVGEV